MSPNLVEALTIYSRRGSGPFLERMGDHSKAALIGMLSDLMTIYINDLNSSTLREFLTVSLAGYQHLPAKTGDNGFKTTGAGETVGCEAKPKNVRSRDFAEFREGRRKNRPEKLRGHGNFTDFTGERLAAKKAARLNMLVSGFVDGRLVYIIEFPFNSPRFVRHLEKQVRGRFPEGRRKGLFVRSVEFNHLHIPDDAVLVYRAENLESYKDFIVGPFYKRLAAMPAPTGTGK